MPLPTLTERQHKNLQAGECSNCGRTPSDFRVAVIYGRSIGPVCWECVSSGEIVWCLDGDDPEEFDGDRQ